MRNTGSSGRSKSNKDKGSSKTSQPQTQNSSTVKPEGPPVKTIQPTAEQVALNNLIHKDTEDAELQNKIKQIMELTGCSQDKAEIALYDNKNDLDRAVNMLFEGNTDEGEWRESGKKKKKQSQNKQDGAAQNENTDTKPEKRDNKDRNDRDNRDRDREDGDNDRNNRDQSDNYRRPRRNDNRPPRLSRGRGRPDRAGDRPEKDDDNDREDHRERGGFERGRGRGRGFGGPRRGRGGGGGSTGGNFRGNQSRFDKTSQFDNGPQIDTWTNETAVIGEKEPKITNWSDSKEDWNEDIDSWTGSLAETKVFTASTAAAPEPPVQLDTNTLSNTFNLSSVLYNSQKQNDISAEASYINQFNQQATESIKNSIGIGSGSTSSLQNSMNSQTASNVSALVSIQNALQQDPMGPSLSAPELAGNSLSGNSLTGNGFVGTSLGNSLSGNSLPVNSLTGSGLNSTSLSGSSLSGSSLTGAGLSGSGLTGPLTASSLSSVAQSIAAAVPSVIPTSSVSQNAMLQQRQKPQRSKLPPPSKIPASAVEMPGHMMTTLDVQFGNLEFGTDSSPFSFGGNESVPNAYSSSASSSTSTNNHVNAQVGQVPLTKSSETMIPSSIMSSGLEQSSPRNSGLYQQSPYTTPTKQNSAENTPKIQSPPEPIQMPGNTTDLKSNQLMSGQTAQVSLPSTKIDSNLSSYSSGSTYQSSGYQGHKSSSGFPSSKPGSYPGNQYQSGSSQNQSGSGQYSSQFGRQSNQNQYQNSSSNQYQSASAYQSPPSGYQSSQTGYQSSQSQFQSNQSQYQSNPNQFQNYQSGSTFQNQSNYPSNQSNQNSLYQTTTASFSSQSQSNSLYSQSSSHTGSYPNQYLNREHASGAGTSYQPPVTQSNSPFKDNQAGASSYRDSTNKSRDTPSDTSYNRDTQSASSFSDSQSLAYNRDSQSVGSSYSRDSSSSSYKRDSKSAGGAYTRDAQSSDNSSFKRDSQSASGSYNSRDNQSFKDTQSSNFRDNQSGTSYGNQTGSYQRDSSQSSLGAGASQTQGSFSAKNYRNNTDLSTSALQTSLPGSKLVDSFSKMGVKEGNLDNRVTSASQFDVTTTTASKSSASSVSLPASTTTLTTSATASTTVTSSNTAKLSTLPTSTSSSSKAPPNLPPGVPLMAQQYIMGQANTLPFYGLQGLQGLQQPLYANIEEFQYLQQRMPPLAANNVYDMTATAAAAAALPIPPTTLTSNSTQPNVPTVPFSGTADSTKMTRVDAQSPTGSVPTTQQSGQAHQQQQQQPQPPYILNYSYYYPPSLIPGAGFQYPMIPMPQVTNAAHAGSPANSQYQQKSYGSHHMQYGTNKVYDELTQQTPDFSKSPYGGSQSQQKVSANSSVTPGSVSSDIQVPGYGKTHAQAFDKQGFHAGTPPPFNLQMAAGQLTTGTQAGPLGAHTAPYGAPFVPMMTHQPHSQVMHHPLQDTSSSNRGSQQSGSHSQAKSASKSYNSASNWSY